MGVPKGEVPFEVCVGYVINMSPMMHLSTLVGVWCL